MRPPRVPPSSSVLNVTRWGWSDWLEIDQHDLAGADGAGGDADDVVLHGGGQVHQRRGARLVHASVLAAAAGRDGHEGDGHEQAAAHGRDVTAPARRCKRRCTVRPGRDADERMFDQPTATTEYIAVDTETNGLSGDRCELTEIGAVLVGGGELHEEWDSLVSVATPLGRGIQRFTGISQEMVNGAPPLEEVLPRLEKMLRGRVLVAHNARFDVRVLRQAFARAALAVARPAGDLHGPDGAAVRAAAAEARARARWPARWGWRCTRSTARCPTRARARRSSARCSGACARTRRPSATRSTLLGARKVRARPPSVPNRPRGERPASRGAPARAGRLHLPRRRRQAAVRRQVRRPARARAVAFHLRRGVDAAGRARGPHRDGERARRAAAGGPADQGAEAAGQRPRQGRPRRLRLHPLPAGHPVPDPGSRPRAGRRPRRLRRPRARPRRRGRAGRAAELAVRPAPLRAVDAAARASLRLRPDGPLPVAVPERPGPERLPRAAGRGAAAVRRPRAAARRCSRAWTSRSRRRAPRSATSAPRGSRAAASGWSRCWPGSAAFCARSTRARGWCWRRIRRRGGGSTRSGSRAGAWSIGARWTGRLWSRVRCGRSRGAAAGAARRVDAGGGGRRGAARGRGGSWRTRRLRLELGASVGAAQIDRFLARNGVNAASREGERLASTSCGSRGNEHAAEGVVRQMKSWEDAFVHDPLCSERGRDRARCFGRGSGLKDHNRPSRFPVPVTRLRAARASPRHTELGVAQRRGAAETLLPSPLGEPLRSAAAPTTAIATAHGQAQSPTKPQTRRDETRPPPPPSPATNASRAARSAPPARTRAAGRRIHAVSPLNPNTIAVASVSALRRTNSRAPPARTIRTPDTRAGRERRAVRVLARPARRPPRPARAPRHALVEGARRGALVVSHHRRQARRGEHDQHRHDGKFHAAAAANAEPDSSALGMNPARRSGRNAAGSPRRRGWRSARPSSAASARSAAGSLRCRRRRGARGPAARGPAAGARRPRCPRRPCALADDAVPVGLQQRPGGVPEPGVVIDDEDGLLHKKKCSPRSGLFKSPGSSCQPSGQPHPARGSTASVVVALPGAMGG